MSGLVPVSIVVSAYETLAAGDGHETLAILGNAIEDAVGLAESAVSGPPRCPTCGARAWPEDIARHVYSLHNPQAWERAA